MFVHFIKKQKKTYNRKRKVRFNQLHFEWVESADWSTRMGKRKKTSERAAELEIPAKK